MNSEKTREIIDYHNGIASYYSYLATCLGDDEFEEGFEEDAPTGSFDYSDDEEWTRRRLELTKEWKENSSNLISLYFKRDHKKQKRIQCGITYKNFFS